MQSQDSHKAWNVSGQVTGNMKKGNFSYHKDHQQLGPQEKQSLDMPSLHPWILAGKTLGPYTSKLISYH